MSTVTVNGNTYSDDGTASRDLTNGGHRQHLLPMLADAVVDLAAKADLATTNGAAQVELAAAQADAAEAAANSAALTADVTKWVSGTTYAQGVVVWSPTDFKTYRRKVAGAGTTDPTTDLANWAQVLVKVNNPGDIVMAIARPTGWLPCDGAQYPVATYPDLAAMLPHTAFPQDESTTSLINGAMASVAYNGTNLYVAVGDGGICSSPDGITWTDRYIAGNLYNVVFANGVWIVPCAGGVLRSTDGLSWTHVTISEAVTFVNAAFGGTAWVVTSNNAVYSSADNGLTWTVRTCTNLTSVQFVKYVNGNFCIGGVHASGSLWTSTDGTTWSQRACANTYTVRDIVFANAIYVVAIGDYSGNSLATSPTLATWTSRTTTNMVSATRVIYAESLFVAVGQGTTGAGDIFTSTDGTTWTARSSGLTCTIYGIVHTGTDFLAFSGTTTLGQLSSADGITWTIVRQLAQYLSSYSYGATNLIWAGGKGVACLSNGGIATSNGAIWTQRRSIHQTGHNIQAYSAYGTPYTATDGTYLGVIGQGGMILFTADGVTWTPSYVADGVAYALMFSGGVWIACMGAQGIWTSADRVTWTQRLAATIHSIAFSGSIYAAVGVSVIYSAATPTGAWTSRASTGLTHNCVVYGNGLFVAGATSGYVFTSSDGLTWTQRSQGAGTPNRLFSLGSLFYSSGISGQVCVSQDGKNWHTPDYYGDKPSSAITCLAYGNGVWVLVGENDGHGQNSIMYSTNGVAFFPAKVSDSSGDDLYFVTFANGLFYATGGNKLFVSEDGINWLTYPAVSIANYLLPVYLASKLILLGDGPSVTEDTTKFTTPIINSLGAPVYIKE